MIAPPASMYLLQLRRTLTTSTFMLTRYTHLLDGKHALTLDLDPEPHRSPEAPGFHYCGAWDRESVQFLRCCDVSAPVTPDCFCV